MALVHEAAAIGNRGDRFTLYDHLTGITRPHLSEICMWSHAHCVVERANQVKGTQPTFTRECVELDGVCKIHFEISASPGDCDCRSSLKIVGRANTVPVHQPTHYQVYFPTSDGMRFKAIDPQSGALKFNVENKAISFSSPALIKGLAYFGSSDGWVHAIDMTTGALKMEFQTDGSKQNASRYIDEQGHMKTAELYPDFTLDGMIIGMDRMFSLGSVLSSPVVSNGILYVGSTDANLYAIR